MATIRKQKPTRRDARRQRRANRRWWQRWWLLLLVLPALALGAVGLLAFYFVFESVPLPDDIDARSSIVLDIAGNEVGGLSAEVSREDVELIELPPHLEHAVLAAEDRGFYEHRGISATGIARALFTNVRAGAVTQGGSTITQQYIKNAELSPEQTYSRKVQEAALAIKLEREYSKQEILSFYLNTIYWGRGAYGIEAAAQTTFDVPASELDVNQAATLAGIIAAPEGFDPQENPTGADNRRRYVLEGMFSEGWLNQAEYDGWVAAGLPEVTARRSVPQGPNAYYLDAVRRELAALPAFAEGELFRGLRIHTQLDQDLQAAAQETLTEAVADGPTDTGAIVTVDPRTGGVLALAGGPDVEVQPFNTAVRSVRQPGSTFKAFTLQAFVEAGYSPESRFPAPAELEIEDAQTPISNFGGSTFGEQTVFQATASSTNTVYVQMQETVGREAVIEAARRAGLPRDRSDEIFPTERENGPALRPLAGLTLGQDVVSPLEMASAYGTYAAEGVRATPHLVTEVLDADGRVVYRTDVGQDQQVDLNVARTVTAGLLGVITGGSGTAADIGRPAAGKTGTTNDSRDVWFVGYVPQLSTSVWLGNLDNSPIEAENPTGGGLAAPVWARYMARAVEGLDVEEFVAPSLGDLETLNEDPDVCPDGYEFTDPPTEADENGFFPDILVDLTDEEGRPCVEVAPDECPDGYEFADPPTEADENGFLPEVLPDLSDGEGRPCVEIAPEPDECPDGYEFGDPPTEPDADGRLPQVLTDLSDEQGRPCVEVLPDPEPDEDPDEQDPDGDGDDGTGNDTDGGTDGGSDGGTDGGTDDGTDGGAGDGTDDGTDGSGEDPDTPDDGGTSDGGSTTG